MISPAKEKTCPCDSCVCQKPVDAKTGFDVTDEFVRFNQKYDMFNRAVWDDEVRSERAQRFFESYFTDLAQFRKVEGFQHRDYALRNAAWYIADFTADLLETTHDRKEGFLDSYTMFREGATRKSEASAEDHTRELKRAGRFWAPTPSASAITTNAGFIRIITAGRSWPPKQWTCRTT